MRLESSVLPVRRNRPGNTAGYSIGNACALHIAGQRIVEALDKVYKVTALREELCAPGQECDGLTTGAVERVLVSACLLGETVRYDGRAAECTHPVLRRWIQEERVVPFCPEVAGGLSVPRPPAEIVGLGVVTCAGDDVTAAFERGARATLQLALEAGVVAAVLKDGSPSCGSTWVYDGTFSGTRRPGLGLAAARLRDCGIPVFTEASLEAADAYVLGRRKQA